MVLKSLHKRKGNQNKFLFSEEKVEDVELELSDSEEADGKEKSEEDDSYDEFYEEDYDWADEAGGTGSVRLRRFVDLCGCFCDRSAVRDHFDVGHVIVISSRNTKFLSDFTKRFNASANRAYQVRLRCARKFSTFPML